MSSIEIIAEIGVNHDGSVDKARRLVDAACDAGADWAKFQTFRSGLLAAGGAPTAAYQKQHHAGDQRSMLERLELSPADFAALQQYCGDRGIGFLSSPFDEESLDDLLALGLESIKLGSGELTNLPLLARLGAARVRVLLSTGMSDLGEVETAVQTLQSAGCRELVLLHCVTQYPAPVGESNLRAIHTLRHAFGLPVGYSDHTPGIEVTVAAAALGAVVLEKHLTLDRADSGPDHAASCAPDEFAALVKAVRNVEAALGDGVKRPAPCELPNQVVARKSLVTVRDLPAGMVVSADDLTIKRPGDGIPPADLENVVGLALVRPVAADQVLRWEDFRHGG